MQAGRLDQRIDLEALTTARDPVYLQAEKTWTPFVQDVPADIQFRSVGTPEPVIGAQQQSLMRVFIRIRYLAGVLSSMRVKHGAKYYQILDVVPFGRNEETRITAVEWNEGRR